MTNFAAVPSGLARSYLHLDDPRIGEWAGSDDGGITYYSPAALSTSPDQVAKFQAAINHAGRDGVPNTIFIGGLFRCGDEVTYPDDTLIILDGAGCGTNISESAAGILFDVDDGTFPGEKYAIRTSRSHFIRMSNFALQGPSRGGDLFGSWPAMRYGVHIDSACVLHDMLIQGFGGGLGLIGDHHKFENLNSSGNGRNVDYLHNPIGGLGDETYLKCQLSNATQASIAVADTNTIANCRMGDNGHCGSAPYGIYRYPSEVGDVVSCSGSAASANITSVALSSRVPTAGARVSGTNIKHGTYITVVAGSSGAYTLTLSQNPTGVVSSVKVYWAPRSTAVVGLVCENWSWEGIGNSVFYDEPNYLYNAPAGWSGITHDSPADIASFSAQELTWTQVVNATGHSGSTTVTGVALSDWIPAIGDYIGTPGEVDTTIPFDTTIADVAGTPGNYTITLSAAATATITEVRIGKPRRLIAYDVGGARSFHWREGAIPVLAMSDPDRIRPYLVRARLINEMRSDYMVPTEFFDNPGSRLFQIYTPYGSNPPGEYANLLDGIELGGRLRGSGAYGASARIAREDILKGQVLELFGYGTVQHYRGTSQSLIVGMAVHDCSAGEVIVYTNQSPGDYSYALNTSGTSIAANTLLKAHPSGGVAAATGPLDGPIVGMSHDVPIANGAVQKARIQI